MMSAIYIDSKVKGAIRQLISYFKEGVFSRDNTEVVFKSYKESFLYYKQALEKYEIPHRYFLNINRLDMSKYKVVFYLFNAQSNCRILTFRNAKHIFVTHGESNKLASIKPIIRIYDYIICAGDVGVRRYLQYKIFTQDDVCRYRVLKMGDTFIGGNPYKKAYQKEGAYILYAPTWEGGIKAEQYSSLSADLYAFKKIAQYAKIGGLEKVLIQPHPNTGHRDKKYRQYLEQGISLLRKNALQVNILGYKHKGFLAKLFNRGAIKATETTYRIYRAFVDVSAMEIQLLNKLIQTNIFINQAENVIPKDFLLQDYYNQIAVKESGDFGLVENLEQIRDFYISYSFEELKDMPKHKRVDWLVDFVTRE
ncbi:hypothetical protein [Helicobacter winghamensis]|nr:hypothetical protein [Helicobacter winghamensis]EEO26557.1 hypothetical protein HWAG_01349 [Helicobacter winghamensis ATCC BAA-430]